MDMAEIRREITRLENGATTYGNLEKLSVLYTVENRCAENERSSSEPRTKKPMFDYSFAAAPLEAESEFVTEARKADATKLLKILDEHMDAISMVYPKEYALIMRKIRESI